VALSWIKSIDSDLRGYRVKRLNEADFAAAATPDAQWNHTNAVEVISRIDSTRCALEGQPVGTHYYMVKAEDFAGNFSVGFSAKAVLVTEDQSGVSISAQVSYDVSLTSNYYYYDNRVNAGVSGGEYLTHGSGGGTEWEDLWPSATDEWEDEFDEDDLWTKKNFTGEVVSEFWDTGADRSGHWAFSAQEILYNGLSVGGFIGWLKLISAAEYPAGDFTYFLNYGGNGSARYIRFASGWSYPGAPDAPAGQTGDDITFKLPFDFTFHGVRVFDSGSVSVPGSGQPLEVVFNKTFSAPPVVRAQLVGSTPGFANPDNITTEGFDLYAWDLSGDEMAATVNWTADGA